jgi:hypothetical protein
MGSFLLNLFFVLAGLVGFFARPEEAMGQVHPHQSGGESLITQML